MKKYSLALFYETFIGSSSKELHEKVLFLFYNDQGLSSLYVVKSVTANGLSTTLLLH